MSIVALAATGVHGQGPQGGRAGGPGGPPGGGVGAAPPMAVPKVVWHGWADQLITAEGTIDYYTRVQQQMGGAGPQPTGQLEALLAWVEDGKAPETLLATRRDQAGTVTRSRPLCPFPQVAKYKGSGSTDDAANFTCSNGF
jgi:hypothetical protein